MPGRNRRNRGPSRNDFNNAQNHDQSLNERPRPPRPFGPTSQDEPRRRSNAQTRTPSAGIHRSNDNSNPGLSSRFRNLKQQSDIVKRELEDLIAQIDELQPDNAAMDWAGSAGTIVYVPVACAPDGSFQHAQMRSISTGEYPNTAATFSPYSETNHAGTSNGDRPDTPVAFTPYAELMNARTSSGTTLPSGTRSSTMVPGEGSVAGRDAAITEHGRATTSTARDNICRPAPGEVIGSGPPRQPISLSPQPGESGESNWDSEHGHVSAFTAPKTFYSRCLSSSNLGGQRTNQPRAAVTSLLTPPPSPVGGYGQSEVRGLGEVALQES